MGKTNLEKLEDTGLNYAVRTYFKGLTNGYSEKTIESYKRILTTRYGISDFGKLRQDFKDGLFD